MRFGSVCSGIEAASVAWHPLGWETAWVSEIEAFPSAVLAHHYPNTPNFGDMTKFKEWPDDSIDILVGGTPCQSFSVAGLRKGLADPRGNLMLTYLAIADRYRPKWLVWENVPGVLSSNKGKDFGTFLGALGELGYGFAYRVLDAQYFGVAQRRRRVFVVGYLGNWRPAAAVLFEPQSLCGDPAPSRKTGESFTHPIAPSLRASGTKTSKVGDWRGQDAVVAMHLNADGMGRMDLDNEIYTSMISNQDGSGISDCVSPTLTKCGTGAISDLGPCIWPAQIASTLNAAFGKKMGLENQHALAGASLFVPSQSKAAPSLTASNDPSRSPQSSEVTQQVAAVHASIMQVRRLTPRECERLQGFPDDYTAIPWRKKTAADCPDGPRYKALGNSMAVPVMRWMGKRIQMIDDLLTSLKGDKP